MDSEGDWCIWIPFRCRQAVSTNYLFHPGCLLRGNSLDPHSIDVGFIRDFVKHIRETSKSDNIFGCGEYWQDSFETTNKYLNDIGIQFTVFDAPLHYNFKEAGEAKANFDLRKIWDGSIVQARPVDAVTCVENHDTQPGQALESWVSSGFKPLAYALILLRVDGYPCVFYGDLYGRCLLSQPGLKGFKPNLLSPLQAVAEKIRKNP